MTNADLNSGDRGNPVILPSSHTGRGRNMYEIYQDSMTITRFHHHPDIFLTMTANPNCPEIKNALLPNQSVTDRPDLVARVFEPKRKALMKEIKEKKVFGTVVAHVYTVEFRKRGLPYIHALIFLKDSEKIRTTDMVNKFVSAEFPDEKNDPILFDTVSKCMVHGPCGERDPYAACMEKGKCTKGYPKKYTDTTTLDEERNQLVMVAGIGFVKSANKIPFTFMFTFQKYHGLVTVAVALLVAVFFTICRSE
ncbi:uncharacterized protein LOC113312973 [Papaver somniferum]|uniref:uncharacterized protein LOC113312973 n=1 Tax=Papaver somniferum TaxID=3469 RepID=UPI000E6F9318|nr:uncharacterized protein LOC113312973 [Papaver somniferum]